MSQHHNDNDGGLTLVVPEALLEAIAAHVAARLNSRQPAPPPHSPWLDLAAACAYTGLSRNSLYKLTAARAIPCRKKANGQGLRFHQAELDTWMESQYPRLDRLG